MPQTVIKLCLNLGVQPKSGKFGGIRVFGVVILVVGLIGLVSSIGSVDAAGPSGVLIKIDGAIQPSVARFVSRATDEARKDGAQYIVVQVDTPGGLFSATRDIVGTLLESQIPVVAYVYPLGARAASAGTFIVASAHIAAMANATNIGCHIDQLYGQSWCHWMGLERVVPHEESKIALSNLYKYSFAPDVGPYRKGMDVIKGGRWYAVAGDGGLIMCTFPKGGAERATGDGQSAWAAMYFNECMTGFEYQAAAHMVAEGLVAEGLAVTRMVHDRYSPSKRNPYNEIECSDHYGRAMASFGVYWNVCGFNIHGPKKQLSINPKIDGEFRCAFIAPDGWGTITHDGVEYKHRV